jgi:hypothetical protein
MKHGQHTACSVSLLVCCAPLRLTSLCPSGRVPQQSAILHTRRHQGQRWLRLRHRREPGELTVCTRWPDLMTTLPRSYAPLAALAERWLRAAWAYACISRPPQAVGQEMMSFSAMSSMAGSLPPNARYVTHRNECYDWGTLGWLLTTKQVTLPISCRLTAFALPASIS